MLLIALLLLHLNDYLSIGYKKIQITSPNATFSLNYTLDYIFLFDYPNLYQVKAKFLDMTESEIIYPSSYGFAGQFLTEVEILPLRNGSHTVQIYSLPKDYCSHNYVSYFSDQHHKTRLSWSNVNSQSFQVCYMYQFPENKVKLTAYLNANGLTTASYAQKEDYINGNFSGKIIPKYTKVTFDLNDGLIVRVQGYSSATSNFDLSIKPTSSSSNDIKGFTSLPFYFVVMPNGYDFLTDLEIQLHSMRESLINLSLDSILGITLASTILFLVLTLTSIFFLKKFNCIKKKDK
ncbi:hypothetical protein M9Y10_015080 [Tritrichomonas musculus]|uniref:Uncharacterized protein n=1 Tax=Tritrichomonas musculus TaxID=1915356 RepID=A0ABR2L1B5_9EUKA